MLNYSNGVNITYNASTDNWSSVGLNPGNAIVPYDVSSGLNFSCQCGSLGIFNASLNFS